MLILLFLIVALIIFIVGNTVRVIRYVRLPLPLRWELYPIPKGPRDRQTYGGSYFEDAEWWKNLPEKDRIGELKFVAKEVLLLGTVHDNFRALWAWSMLLHWGLYLCLAAIVIGAVALLKSSMRGIDLAASTHAVGCLLGLIGSFGLLAVRLTHSRLRGYTGRLTIFNLLLLGAIFATGLLSFTRLLVGLYFLVPFSRGFPGAAVELRLPFVISLHLGLVAFFLAYFPLTHMTHAYMKFFSWHGVRWDDAPAIHDRRVSDSLTANLKRRVTWSAPHIASDRVSSWADVVADVAGKGGAKRA